MIIQCENCKTRFKLADEKLKPGGVKVRCTNCKQVFSVVPPGPSPEAEKPAPPPASPVAQDTPEPSPPSPEGPEADTGSSGREETVVSASDQDLADQLSDPTGAEESSDDEFGAFDMGPEDDSENIDEDTFVSFDEGESDELADSDLSLDGLDEELGSGPAKEELADDLDFEDFEGDDETTSEPPDDFSFDDVETSDDSFDEGVSIGGDLGETFEMDDTGDEPLPALDGAFDDDDALPMDDAGTSIEFDTDESPSGEEGGAFGDSDAFDFSADTNSGEDFDDFGSEDVDEMPGGDEFSFEDNDFDTGLEIETEEKTADAPVETSVSEPEMPPQQFAEDSFKPKAETKSPPPAKKKKSSKSATFLLLIILIIGGGFAGLGWHFQTYDPMELYSKVQEQFLGKPQIDPNSKLAIGKLSSYFVENQSVGQLFVIEGEITNNNSQPRSAISVKGTVYDDKGGTLREQIVFCGNPIGHENLTKMSFNKVEERMNNQFGELLSNTDLKTGQAVPFTIVFKNLPQKVAEYSVIVADSRAGSND
ncbi:MAG: hypothetical protein C0616_11400 [Desulfuromonas sp.]|nr:MAG: hypothetical protein C0616_11400 [Desulfuromonas sp.]